MKVKEIVRQVLSQKSADAVSLPILSLRQRGVIPFPKARIASDLVPKANRLVKAGTQIYVIGYDAPNCELARYKDWIKALKLWLRRGATIIYFLQKATDPALKHLSELANSDHKGALIIYTLKRNAHVPERIKSVLKEWEVSHFAIFERPFQFWFESYHAPGQTEAEDCYYFPRRIAENSVLPKQYKRLMKSVIEQLQKAHAVNVLEKSEK